MRGLGAECTRAQGLVSAFLDGDLDKKRQEQVARHLRACLSCERICEETRQIKAGLRHLAPLEPRPACWGAIGARLEEERQAELVSSRRWKRWLTRAGLSVSLAAAVGACWVLVWPGRSGHQAPAGAQVSRKEPRALPETAIPREVHYESALAELERADAEYLRAIADLRSLVEVEKTHWPVRMAESVKETVKVIDGAIERQREVIRLAPAAIEAREALYASYRRQIDVLQEAVIRGEVGE
jgi:hypothetical protein